MSALCWEDGRTEGKPRSSCLLPAQHDGPHCFTPDEFIFIALPVAAPRDMTQEEGPS